MKLLGSLLTAMLATTAAAPAFAYQCDDDCGHIARFRYPCPTFSNPGRKCTGRDPVQYGACETAKAASCEIWRGAVNYAAPRMRPLMEGEFNAGSWRAAVESDKETEYMTKCQAAGVAAAAALGAQLGGPWGAGVTGGIGLFVAYQVCEQSRSW